MKIFKFFQGYVEKSYVVTFDPSDHGIDVPLNIEIELTALLSDEISREIDESIIREMTRRINGEEGSFDYLNRWLSIGENRA